MGSSPETIGIICAIVLATCVGFFFEWDAMRRFRRLNLVNDDIPVKVVRDGEMTRGSATRCGRGRPGVCRERRDGPGRRRAGRRPYRCKINESTLTGEPEVDKTYRRSAFSTPRRPIPPIALLRGTTVADGYGEMVVDGRGRRAPKRGASPSSRPSSQRRADAAVPAS